MKNIWLGAVALMAAGAANAAWVVDGTTLSDAETGWAFTVSRLSGGRLTITAITAEPTEATDLDFSNLPNGDKIDKINRQMFMNKTNLKRVIAPNLTTTDRRTFQGSSITYFSAASLATLTYADLRACKSLTEVDLPKCTGMQGGNDINYGAIAECSALTTVNLPLLKSVCENGFRSCTSLETLDLPSCTSVGPSAFRSCSNLKTLTLNPNAETITLSNYAFSGCSKLEFPPSLAVSLTSTREVFYNCQNLTGTVEVVANSSDKCFSYNAFRNSRIRELIISASDTTRLGAGAASYDGTNQNALYDCTNLVSVTVMSKTFKEVGLEEVTGCKVLQTLDFSCSTNNISFKANAISLSQPLDIYLAKVPTFAGANGIKTTDGPSRIHVTFDAVKDEEDFDSATEIAAWKAAVAEYADVFADYKANRDDVPAGCIGVLRCAKEGSAAVSKEYFDYAYVVANYPPDGTVLLLK